MGTCWNDHHTENCLFLLCFLFLCIDFFSSLQLVWMLDEGETAIVYLWNIYEPGKAICVALERWWRAGLEHNAGGRGGREGRRGGWSEQKEEKIGCLGKKGDVTPTPASSKIRVFSSRLLIRAAVYHSPSAPAALAFSSYYLCYISYTVSYKVSVTKKHFLFAVYCRIFSHTLLFFKYTWNLVDYDLKTWKSWCGVLTDIS